MSDRVASDIRPKLFPGWVPSAALLYLEHTEKGLSMRQLAQRAGVHASTVMRQIRKLENRRDDRLVDEALKRLGRQYCKTGKAESSPPYKQKDSVMNMQNTTVPPLPDEAYLNDEAVRILRRLTEHAAVLAVSAELEKAVVVREIDRSISIRTAVVDRRVAEVMALKNWIDCGAPGRISRYHITSDGRAALTQLLAQSESRIRNGFTESQTPFVGRDNDANGQIDGTARRLRYNTVESPLTLLARRKDKDGKPFLATDLVAAGERLREDFELSRLGTRSVQNWDRFLTEADRSGSPVAEPGYGPAAARERVTGALRDLGPGLGDVALRCCCYLEGLEAAEKRMGWSARSGKIVLRIALQRLKRHYELLGDAAAMIG
ncbi:hypothetical protein TG4357_00162 [Thalassovita gelatinovora]|uniref:DUF6456 domain-containing protein n=1 Tax=Thalassovita gelatinovora TaxID=53501 RepID=A0A0P1F464_THAGE|nr:DUF6456 domain-containing protein [Thalassovita gelatinovora]QIZ82439.1 MarR family transcriptional regulator [Thalassovita gelatinovora]CUH62531.1 hypothetical protein TG4357_00162 [Thalassovita gelatinovora]SEQ06069.1 hypothetical protein SAMN04488043_10362 [Thalassovita gelatinovora]